MVIAALQSSHRARPDRSIPHPEQTSLIFTVPPTIMLWQMADDPSHRLLFMPSDVRDSMRQSEDKPAISQVGTSRNSDGGCNSIASHVGDDGLSPVSITRTNDMWTTAKERRNARSIK